MTKYFYLFLIFVSTSLSAQVSNDYPNIIPPSPTAYELGKYGQVPVGLFTGTPNINIPIITFKTPKLSVPISLSYNSNGIKVDQMETNVGLGWSLNAGGVISKIIRDKSDEENNYIFPINEITDFNNLETINFFYKAGHAEVDTETDLFMYNFQGFSGKFVYGNDKSIVQLPASALKIEPIIENTKTGYKITTPDGVKYYFLESEVTTSNQSGDGHPAPVKGITAWFMSRIEHPSGDIIYFNYSDMNYSYCAGNSQSIKIAYPYFQTICNSMVSSTPVIKTYSNTIYERTKQISEISSNNPLNGKIIFSSKFAHPDVNSYKLVDSISLINNNNIEIEHYNFDYLATTNKRVLLEKIRAKDPNKIFVFNYIDAIDLPKRLSYSQDHWGYFNQRANTYFVPKTNQPPFSDLNFWGNRELSNAATQIGLIKKISYPTGGYNEFTYESNNYWGVGQIAPSEFLDIVLEATSNSLGFGGSQFSTSTLLEIPFKQRVDIKVLISLDEVCGLGLPDKAKGTFTLTDNQTNEIVQLFYHDINRVSKKTGNSFNIADSQIDYFAELGKGTYTITITPTNKCVKIEAGIHYSTKLPIYGNKNIATGGARINKIITFDQVNNKTQSKRYYYGSILNTAQSSGCKGADPLYVSNYITKIDCSTLDGYFGPGLYVGEEKYQIISSSSLNTLYNIGNNNTTYQYITISHGGDNFENGGEEHEFIVNNDIQADLIWGLDFIVNTPYTNSGWDNGLEKNIKHFKVNTDGSKTVLNSTENHYKTDYRLYKEVLGYSVRKNYDDVLQTLTEIDNLDIMSYKNISYWFYQDSKTTKVYDINGQNPIITTENYFYDNPAHLQLTRKETIGSDNKTAKEQIYYANDLALTDLVNQYRISEPVKIENYINNILTNTKQTDYINWGNNLIQPQYIKTALGANTFENSIQFHSYDNLNGNVTELTGKDNVHVVYLWGYSGKYPIAEIKNATLADVTSALTGTTPVVISSSITPDMTKVEALRTSSNLTGVQITTFTYKPLVGILTKTDPRGVTTYYEYDNFNRLKSIKDKDGKIIQNLDYNYKH